MTSRNQKIDLDSPKASGNTNADSALLTDLSRALAQHLGTGASATIKAARKESNRIKDIVLYAAHAIEDRAAQKAFVDEARIIVKSYRAEKKAPVTGPIREARLLTPVTEELMQRAEDALAPIVGPIAGTLVLRYAVATDSSREFFSHLATHLRTKNERDVFFENVRTRNGLLKSRR
jgi:hypothetical protein